MERRRIPDRRKTHMFFSDERRTGPFDRRNADARRRERAQEIAKIKKIREYKEQDVVGMTPSTTPTITRKRLAAVGLIVLLLAIVLFFII